MHFMDTCYSAWAIREEPGNHREVGNAILSIAPGK